MKKTLIAIVSLLLLSGACWSDDLEANVDEAKYYDNAKVVRIKSVEGEGFVRRSYDEGDEEATVNLPLFEKDTLGTTDGRLAVYLGRMNTLRLDGDTVVVLERIPQLRKTDLALRLEAGSIYLEIESLDREKGIEIQTPDCGVFLLDKGVYRVNVKENEVTEVFVHEGIAEVSGEDDSRNVRENQKIVMARGRMEERPYYFYASEKDDFDRWNEEQDRELGYARYGTSRYLEGGYEDYEYEMSRAGRWTYMSEYSSYAWSPYYADSDWMPYSNGRWVWHPYYGYVWTSYDHCGWFTHHYGRWHWDYSRGWYWLPSYHWSPAWVSWFWDDHHYGWCPLSWWNRPVVIINNHWDRHYDYHRGIPRHSRSTIIIRKNELAAPNIHRVALRKDQLGQNQNVSIAFRGKAPSDRPVDGKVTVINARGKSVTYKQGGVVSSEKYRAHGSDIRDSVYKYDPGPNGSRVYRSKSGDGGTASLGSSTRARTRDAGSSSSGKSSSGDEKSSASSGSSSKTGFRSRSGSSSGTSSSTTSSKSGSSTTVKKKKGEPSYLSRFGGGYSGGTGSGAAPASARPQGTNASEGSRYSYRSYGSRPVSQDGAASSASSNTYKRYIGSILSAGKNSSSYSPSASSYRSRSYELGGGSTYRPGSAAGSYGGGSQGGFSGSTYSRSTNRSFSPSSSSYRPSSSSSSGSSYRSSSSSSSASSHRASSSSAHSSSSSSSHSSSSRAEKKK